MKKLFLILLFLPLLATSQGDQTTIFVPIAPGVTIHALLHLPGSYTTGSKRYGLLYFGHGAGEAGTDLSEIYNNTSKAGGPAYAIAHGDWPASFVNPKDGLAYELIVLTPQYTSSAHPTSGMGIDSILTYVIANYRVDTSMIYLTGLSDGGIGIIENAGKINTAGTTIHPLHQIAAEIPMSAVMNAGLRSSWAVNYAADSVWTWGFGSPSDTHGANTQGLIFIINSAATGLGRFTSYPTASGAGSPGGHCCWQDFYTPEYKEKIGTDSMNIYQWLLTHRQKGYVAPLIDSSKKLVAVWPSEYKCFYRSFDSTAYGMYYNNDSGRTILTAVNTGGRKIVNGWGALYSDVLLDDQGYCWLTNNSNPNATRVDTDTSGAAFNGIASMGALTFTFFAAKTDGSLWMWGLDNYKLFGTDANASLLPVQVPGQPAGKKVLKVIPTNAEIVMLMTTGEVYEIIKGSRTWVQKTLPSPATDIAAVYEGAYFAILPTDTAVNKDGYPYGWGKAIYLGSGSGTVTTPINLTTTWGLTGNPIHRIVAGENVYHFITANGHVWSGGSNTQGLIGNGYEYVNKKDSVANQYVYDYVRDVRIVSPPVDVSYGRTFKALSQTSSSTTFYWYAIGADGSLYACGRSKSKVIATPEQANNESTYPNFYDRDSLVMVRPWDVVFNAQNFVPNILDAGSAQNISATSATLSGSGTVSTFMTLGGYQWTKVSGAACTITSPTAATTTATGLTTGTYLFKLLMRDNNDGEITDTVRVNVTLPTNPTANAGSDQVITLPASSATLNGTASSAVSPATLTYLWTKTSGAGSTTITGNTTATPTVSGLQQGVYVFNLVVTDSNGNTSSDTVQVTVNAAPSTINYLHFSRRVNIH